MRKPPYLSNKKWNKKFKKNMKKFQNLANPSNEERSNKPLTGLLADDSLLGNKLLNKWKLTQIVSGMNNHRAHEMTTMKTILEVRLEDLEKTLKVCVEKIESLQEQAAEHTEKLKMLSDPQVALNTARFSNNSYFQMSGVSNPPVQLTVPLPAPIFLSDSVAPPPPPPPPPPPMGLLNVQNHVVRKPSTVKKPSHKSQILRPAISLEDIINVKLKKTPFALRNDRTTKVTPSNELPRISLEALRSVKLKKTSALMLKETSPIKSKSPKGKIRHVLRRLPISLSPGGTPKGRSNVISDQDDMTPVMTRALLKRFDAFQMSPDSEENKENDIQFI